MKLHLTVILWFITAGILYAQPSTSTFNAPKKPKGELKKAERFLLEPSAYQGSLTKKNTAPNLPIGTTITDAVTAIKIGESSNLYSFLLPSNNQISTVNGVGTNEGSVAFIYRQNINNCGGTASDNGRLRYSISTSGGQFWNTGPGACYGLGVLNPFYSQSSRYANLNLFVPPGSAMTTADLKITYSAAVLNTNGTNWDGAVFGLNSNVATSPNSDHEIYPFQGGNQYFSYSLTERVPGEFWAAAFTWDGANIGNDIILNRGIYDGTTNQVNWTAVTTLSPNYDISFDGAPKRGDDIGLSFSPDGTIGYVAIIGDLVGNQDSVFAPCFASSNDGGVTWGNFEEFDFTQYYPFGLMDTIVKTIDPVTGLNFSDQATTAFDFDLTVDKNGNPHIVAVVGGATGSTSGIYSLPGYSIFTDAGMAIFDFTKDSNDAWNMICLSRQATLRGTLGDINGTQSDFTTADPWMQASRSPDGSKVFFSWTDSDTTGIGGSVNNDPDFITIGVNVDSFTVSQTTNWTKNDLNFSGKAFLPKIPPVAFYDGQGVNNIPTVVASIIPGASIVNPASFFYFNNIEIHDSTINQPACFFFNCGAVAFNHVLDSTGPDCGMSNGKAWITAGGGTAPYTYQWSSGSTTDTAFALMSGTYTVTITDAIGCSETQTFTLNNVNAPVATVTQITNASCFGFSDGGAMVAIAGGSMPYTYSWSNGATTQNLTGVPAGTYNLTITDNGTCNTFTSVTITEPADFNFTGTAIDATCNGTSDGTVTVAVVGAGTFTYSWSNGATTQNLANIPAGTYQVAVTSDSGCTKIDSFVVSEPTPIIANFSSTPNTNCANPTGTITATGSGGSGPPYIINWTGPGGFVVNNSPFIFGLIGGVYVATITDGQGCVLIDSTTVIGASANLVSSVVMPDSCGGLNNGSIALVPIAGTSPYTYSWNNGATTQSISNLAPGTYTCNVIESGGCSEMYSATVGEVPAMIVSPNVTNVSCPGDTNGSISLSISGGTTPYVVSWSTGDFTLNISNLSPGSYDYFLLDDDLCFVMDTIEVNEPQPFLLTSTSSDPLCFGENSGSASIMVMGGTMPYAYSWSNGFTGENNTGLISGMYSVVVTDGNGCDTTTNYQLSDPAALTISSSSTPNNGTQNGTATTTVTGGTPPYAYAWSNGDTDATATNLDSLSYTVTATDANGCTIVDTVEIGTNVSIDEFSSLGISQFNMYPNPTKDVVSITLTLNDLENPEIRLFDLSGKTIFKQQEEASAFQFEYEIPMTTLAEGVYLLSVQTNRGTLVRRITKIK